MFCIGGMELSVAKVRKIVIGVLAISLIPMIIISFYNHPSADDFGVALTASKTWNATHNPVLVVMKALGSLPEWYMEWMGAYTSLSIMFLSPHVFGERWYALCTPLLVGFTIFSVVYFCRKLFSVFSDKKEEADIVAVVVSLIILQRPVHAIQAFYWWCGSVNYVPCFGMMIMASVVMARLAYGKPAGKRELAFGIIMSFLASGGSPVIALVNVELMVVLFIASLIQQKRVNVGGALITLFGIIGFIINVVAPGNGVREATFQHGEEWSVSYVILRSVKLGYEYFAGWMTPMTLLLLAAMIPVIWHAYREDSGQTCKGVEIPVFVWAVGLFLLYASSFTPSLYVEHDVGPRRCQNVRLFMAILLVIVLETMIVVRIKRKLFRTAGENAIEKINTWACKQIIPALVIGVIALSATRLVWEVFPKDVENEYLTSVCAARSLLKGEAQQYHRDRMERLEILLSDEMNPVFEALDTYPVLLYYASFELSPDSSDWRNRDMAEYYGKETISVR